MNLTPWLRALQIAEEWRASLHRIYEQITNQSSYFAEAELERRIMEVVGHLKNPTASEMSAYIRSPSTLQIGQAADGLAEMGLLWMTTKPWGKRTIKRYQIPVEEEMK